MIAWLAGKAASRATNKLDKMRYVFVVDPFHVLQRGFEREHRTQEKVAGPLQVQPGFGRKAGAPQPDGIQTADAARVSIRDEERKHILHDFRLRTHHGIASQPNELMDADFVGKKNVILRHDVAGEGRAVGKDAIVSQPAVVCDVDPDHEKISRADLRHFMLARRTMNGHAFANQVIVADREVAAFAFELHVLRFPAERGVFEDAISFAQRRVAFDNGVRTDFAARPDPHAVFNDDVRSDLYIGGNFGKRTNYGCRMNHHAGDTVDSFWPMVNKKL